MEKNFIVQGLKNNNNLISIHNKADIYNNKGLNYFQNNDFENAIICFFQALNYDKNYAHAYSNIGNILIQKGEFEEAINMYQKAIEIENKNSLYFFNLGIAYSQVNDYKLSAREYKKSLQLDPKNLKAYKFLGNCYINLKDFKKAIDIYRRWSQLDPQNPEPKFILGQIHIRNGRFNLGWKLYEYGLKNNIRKPLRGFYNEKKEMWDGKPFNGTLLVYGEQGLGDQINFGTLFDELLDVQKNICIKVNKKLFDIFTQTYPTVKVYCEDEDIPQKEYDKYIAIGSLNKFFRSHTNDYLNSRFNSYKVFGKRHNEIHDLFSRINGFKLGISWHSFSSETGQSRCLKTQDLAKIVSIDKINFFNIQYGNVHNQLNEIKLITGREILRVPFVDLTNDISSVANIISHCDLIISVDNTTAHLAASIGKPVWLLLPYNADFRWMEDITTSLWYKNVTLIRQQKVNDWSNEIEIIYKSLNESNINKK